MASPIVRAEAAHSINGVPGRMFAATVGGRAKAPGTFCSQKWAASRPTPTGSMRVKLRFDDDCGNGHNTFSMTCDIFENGRDAGGGAAHEEIAKVFPELAPLIKWHLVSTDAPMHYIANASFLASDRDCWGRRKGEPSSWSFGLRFNDVPVTHRVSEKLWHFIQERKKAGAEFQVLTIGHDNKPGDTYKFAPKYSLAGFSATKWHECPFDDETEATEMCRALNDCTIEFVKVPTAWSDGKERELDGARRAAIWPEATDEELCSPDLKEKLAARLPGLMAEFRKDMEAAGFLWESPQV